MKSQFKNAIPIAQAFAKLLHPFAEVAIHNLEEDKIEAIYNSFSKREIGDDSYLDRWDFTIDPTENVIGPYEKINFDGRKLKSISLVLRDDYQKAIGFICINMDVSIFENYSNTLQIFLSNNDRNISEQKQEIFKDDLYEQINSYVQKYCQERQISLDAFDREAKKNLILNLNENGAFKGKNATSYIARILNISRATVYNYLKNSGRKTT